MIDTVYYDEKIRFIGQQLIDAYKSERIVYCGINGPYDDPETKVRNLSHLIVITSIEILKYDNSDLIETLSCMGSELISLRNSQNIYCMREKEGKDQCNGVIGHAWVLEAYYYLYKVIKDREYLTIADSIIGNHEFSYKLGLWGRPGMGSDDRAIDYTLNHQLWFAASLAEINTELKSDEYENQVNVFLKKLNHNMKLSKQGKVAHEIYSKIGRKYAFKSKIKRVVNMSQDILGLKSYAYKEVGYHVFNLMAIARLFNENTDCSFWDSSKIKKAFSYVNKRSYLTELESDNVTLDASFKNKIDKAEEKTINIYGYPYNVPGFELLYVDKIFDNQIKKVTLEYCIKRQFELTYDGNEKRFQNRCHDKVVINYRVYEYYRYLEVD